MDEITKAKERKFDDIDLGLKVGTKEEAAWNNILKAAELEIEQFQRAIIVNKAIIRTAKKMMREEKKKQRLILKTKNNSKRAKDLNS